MRMQRSLFAAFVVAALLGGATTSRREPAAAQPAGDSWRATTGLDQCKAPSPSCTGRDHHSATLLESGKVLVAGGSGNPNADTTAQIFNPATETWDPTGPIPSSVGSLFTASLLPKGKVLLVGDILGGSPLYDAGTGNWSSAPSPRTGRGAHTATALRDGRIFVAGGLGGGVGTAAAEMYNPATNSWEATAPMVQLRYQHAASLLRDGRVLVAGGWSDNYGPKRKTAELYDPATATWAPTGGLDSSPTDATATLLDDGRVLLAGGESSESNSTGNGGDRKAQLYDPSTGTWSGTGDMLSGRSLHTATLLSDGRVLVVGGNPTIQTRGGEPPSDISAELYDPSTGTWTAAPPLAPTRFAHTATLLPEGPVAACGKNCGHVVALGGKNLSGQTGMAGAHFYPTSSAGVENRTPQATGPVEERTVDGRSEFPVLYVVLASGVAIVGALVFLTLRRHQHSDAPSPPTD